MLRASTALFLYMHGMYLNGRLVSGHPDATSKFVGHGIYVLKENTIVTFDTGTALSEYSIKFDDCWR